LELWSQLEATAQSSFRGQCYSSIIWVAQHVDIVGATVLSMQEYYQTVRTRESAFAAAREI